MNCLLTGATGFVGSALLTRLIADNADITALVRSESTGLPRDVKRVVSDLSALKSDIHSEIIGSNPWMMEEVVKPKDDGGSRFVFVSTVNVNGKMTRPGELFKPEIPQPPLDDYGLSKYEAEQGLLQIVKETGMEEVIILPPLVYVPNAKGNFATMAKWVRKGVPLALGAVHNQRSLVALENLVDFMTLCADRERSPKADNQVFLISDGQDVSTTELLRKVAHAQGKSARLIPVPVGLMKFAARILGTGAVADRLFGNLQVDSSKAQELLGWQPVVTMDEALERMFSVEG